MRFLIMLIISIFFTPAVISNQYDNNASNMAKERSAELVISSVRTAYEAAYMKNSGKEPSLTELATTVRNDLTNASVTTEKNIMKVVANDVTCIFTVGSDSELKLTNACDGFYKDDEADIGIVSAN